MNAVTSLRSVVTVGLLGLTGRQPWCPPKGIGHGSRSSDSRREAYSIVGFPPAPCQWDNENDGHGRPSWFLSSHRKRDETKQLGGPHPRLRGRDIWSIVPPLPASWNQRVRLRDCDAAAAAIAITSGGGRGLGGGGLTNVPDRGDRAQPPRSADCLVGDFRHTGTHHGHKPRLPAFRVQKKVGDVLNWDAPDRKGGYQPPPAGKRRRTNSPPAIRSFPETRPHRGGSRALKAVGRRKSVVGSRTTAFQVGLKLSSTDGLIRIRLRLPTCLKPAPKK